MKTAVELTGWSTASARDWKDSGSDIAPRPDNGKDRVVTFWAEPSAIFRPSPDRRIDDSSADLETAGSVLC